MDTRLRVERNLKGFTTDDHDGTPNLSHGPLFKFPSRLSRLGYRDHQCKQPPGRHPSPSESESVSDAAVGQTGTSSVARICRDARRRDGVRRRDRRRAGLRVAAETTMPASESVTRSAAAADDGPPPLRRTESACQCGYSVRAMSASTGCGAVFAAGLSRGSGPGPGRAGLRQTRDSSHTKTRARPRPPRPPCPSRLLAAARAANMIASTAGDTRLPPRLSSRR